MFAILFGIISGFADNIRYNVQRQMEMKKKMMAKKIAAGILLFVGLILFLNGIALMIDTFADNFWIGHTLVGLVVTVIGYLMLQSNNRHY